MGIHLLYQFINYAAQMDCHQSLVGLTWIRFTARRAIVLICLPEQRRFAPTRPGSSAAQQAGCRR